MTLAASIEVVTACFTHLKPVDSCTAWHIGVHVPVYEEEDEEVADDKDDVLENRASSNNFDCVSDCSVDPLLAQGSTYK